MADIEFSTSDYTGTRPLYFVALQESTGYYIVQDEYGPALEVYNATDWPQYGFSLTLDSSTGLYASDFPSVPDGLYFVRIYAQLGSTPATTDLLLADGDFEQQSEPQNFADQMQLDGYAFIRDFGEPITYYQYDKNNNLLGTYDINAVINRNPPAVVQEDGKVLADDLEINICNDLYLGVLKINKGRDKIFCSGRYGGAALNHTVTLVASGDSGIWTVRAK